MAIFTSYLADIIQHHPDITGVLLQIELDKNMVGGIGCNLTDAGVTACIGKGQRGKNLADSDGLYPYMTPTGSALGRNSVSTTG